MRKHNVARDRQAEPRAAGLPIAGGFEPLERLEGLIERFRGDPRSIVSDGDDPVRRVLAERYARRPAVTHRVVDQIREHPPDRCPLAQRGHWSGPSYSASAPASDASSQRL